MKPITISLEHSLEHRLRDLLDSIPWLGQTEVSRNPAPFSRAYDIKATIKMPSGNTAELWVECKDLPRPSQFPYVALETQMAEDGAKHTLVPVLAAPYISPRMAELAYQHGWGWYDLAGNCRLSIPGGLYIERTGFDPVHERPRPRANLSTAASARVLRALLAPQNTGLGWNQTGLRGECWPNVSIGLVNKVVRHLRDEAWIMESAEGGFKVHDRKGLLETWRKAYRFDRHQRIGFFSLLKPHELEERLAHFESIAGRQAAYAAFSAADIQAPNVRQPKTWLYVAEDYLDDLQAAAEAKPVDSGETLVVLVPEDPGVFYFQDGLSGDRLPCTNPVQTYVDLFHVGGRGEEAAEAILHKYFEPAQDRSHP